MNDFVTIKSFDNFVTANFDKQKLEANDISCYLADEYTITIKWILCNAMGGIKLRVPENDVTRAMLILEEKGEELQVDFSIEQSDLVCPQCGSNNTSREKFSRSVAALSWLIVGFPIRCNPKKNSRCFNCGTKWRG